MGHEDAFPPTTLSNRSRLDKPTFAGTRSNEQDAPKPDIRAPLVLRFRHLIQLICLRIAGPAVSSRSKVKHLTVF
jgi:hypothetical protein